MRLPLLVLAAFCTSGVAAHADSVYNNLSPSANYGLVIPAGKAAAAAFTPSGTYTLTSAEATIESLQPGTLPVDFAIYTTSTSANIPGTLLYDLGTVNVGNVGVYTANASGPDLLSSNVEYWLVLTNNGTTRLGWADEGTSSEQTANNFYGNKPGFSNQGPEPMQLAINGNPVSAVTPEPSSIALLGTGLLGVAGAFRKRFQ